MSPNPNTDHEEVAIPRKYIIAAQTAACLWLTAWAFFIWIAARDENFAWIARLGQIGDAFGPLTSFLTAAALFTAVVATFVQVREFRNQLREMRDSAKEMKDQTQTYREQLAEAKNQTKILKAQQSEGQIRHAAEGLPFLIAHSEKPSKQLYIYNRGSKVYAVTFGSSVGFASKEHSALGTITDFAIWVPDDKQVILNYNHHDGHADLWIDYTLHSGERIQEQFVVKWTDGEALYSDRAEQIARLKVALETSSK